MFLNFLSCKFNNPKCKSRLGCKCAKGGTTVVQPPPPQAPPPLPTATETAQDVLQAQLATARPAAELEFSIFTDPNIGILPRTQAVEDARSQVFGGESQVRDALLQNILGNLASPTGASPEQLASVEALRERESGRLSRRIQESANLGGGLFGGRRQQREDEAQTQFGLLSSESDIARDERNRLNAIQAALPALQILFPEANLQAPQFQSPAPTANAVLGASAQARGQDVGLASSIFGTQSQFAQQQLASQSQLQSALFGALGTAVGGLCWVAAEIFGDWYHPKTCASRRFINEMAPEWFKRFYIKYGERIAEFISDKPILKLILRPLFEVFALKGRLKWQI